MLLAGLALRQGVVDQRRCRLAAVRLTLAEAERAESALRLPAGAAEGLLEREADIVAEGLPSEPVGATGSPGVEQSVRDRPRQRTLKVEGGQLLTECVRSSLLGKLSGVFPWNASASSFLPLG